MGDPIWADHYGGVEIARTAPEDPVPTSDEWATHLAFLRNHSHSDLLSDKFVLAGARQYYAMVSLIDQRIGDLSSRNRVSWTTRGSSIRPTMARCLATTA